MTEATQSLQLAPEHKVVLTTDAAGVHRGRRAQAGQQQADRRDGGLGTPDAIARRRNEHLEAGADHVAIQAPGGWSEDTLRTALTELAGPLGLTGAG